MADSETQRVRLALVTLLGQYRGMVQTYAYAIIGDFSLVEDVYQEVSLAVVNHWNDLPSGPGIVPWLKEVTRRCSLGAVRRFGRRRAVLDADVLDQIAAAVSSEPDERDSAALRRETLSRCVEKLSGDARAVITGRYWENLSCEDLARRIGRTVKSVYGILARGRLAVAECVRRSGNLSEEGA